VNKFGRQFIHLFTGSIEPLVGNSQPYRNGAEMNAQTTASVARLISERFATTIEEWQVRRVFELGLLPDPPRFANKRVIFDRDIPAIIDALRARGWLPQGEATNA
jgi:hypothetical protein